MNVCVPHTRLSQEKYWLEFCISGWNHMLQHYIESATALSNVDDEEPQEYLGFVGRQKRTSST